MTPQTVKFESIGIRAARQATRPLCVPVHQYGPAPSRVDGAAGQDKACLLESPASQQVVRVRVDSDCRHAALKELVDMLPHEARPVTDPEHRGIADVDIHAARARRQVVKVMRGPILDGVVLDECKWTLLMFCDPQ